MIADRRYAIADQPAGFQCSSTAKNEPKFLKYRLSSINQAVQSFQYSSASRKFLNPLSVSSRSALALCFSALQRAEIAEMAYRSRKASYAG